MEIIDVLNNIGLDKKQAAVYLALLELGTAAVQIIAQKAQLKRPTTYLILDELQAKGLVSIVPRARKVLYTAESPDKLMGDLNKKHELMKRYMPNLLAMYNVKKEKPQVRLFEGKEGIKEVYNQIYNSNGVSFFGTVKEALFYDPEGLNAFVERSTTNNFQIRDLLTLSDADIMYAKKAKTGSNYQIRFVDKDKVFLTDNAIFGNNVVFFSFHPQIFAVMITSREISQAIKTLFEFAWASGESYEKVMNDNGKSVLV